MSVGDAIWAWDRHIPPEVALIDEVLKIKESLSTDLDQIRADVRGMDALAERVDRIEHQMQEVCTYMAQLHQYLQREYELRAIPDPDPRPHITRPHIK